MSNLSVNRDPAGRYAYPLSALFILVSACAAIVAFMTPVLRHIADGPIGTSQATMAVLAGAIYSATLGAIVGLYHHDRRRGCLWGILTGAALGAALGPVALAPVDAFPSLLSIAVGGSLLLVAISAGFRLLKR